MSKLTNAKTECRMVGDYFDEAECPNNFQNRIGKSEQAKLVADYQDDWVASDILTEISVVLKDGDSFKNDRGM